MHAGVRSEDELKRPQAMIHTKSRTPNNNRDKWIETNREVVEGTVDVGLCKLYAHPWAQQHHEGESIPFFSYSAFGFIHKVDIPG